MLETLGACALFRNMDAQEIETCLRQSGAKQVQYVRGALIFDQLDTPQYQHVLLRGTVSVCSETLEGKRNLMAMLNTPGELFGEVFLFLGKQSYDHYAMAESAVTVLQIPKAYFFEQTDAMQGKLIANMLTILAQKAYYLNRRLQVMSQGGLRQKIALAMLQNMAADGSVQLAMNREKLANYLGTARPSLSRELMRMQEEGLLRVNKQRIWVLQPEQLQNIL